MHWFNVKLTDEFQTKVKSLNENQRTNQFDSWREKREN